MKTSIISGALLMLFAVSFPCSADTSPSRMGHPRLYFTAGQLSELRGMSDKKVHKRILGNIVDSAEWCLTKTPRTEWIAPKSPDPIYLNLYNRFYGMMQDTAIMEHLSFAYAYTGDKRYLDAARKWTLSCVRVWKHEADGDPDASKAYAVTRVLKGVSTAYDILYNDLTIAERREVRGMLAEVGHKYYQWYLDNPTMGTIQQGKHHASVEVTSFGITALALLGDEPEAGKWLDLMVEKFTQSLLPNALEPSGAQVEGATFWASTMQYRMMFMDALRTATGRDLFKEYAKYMDGKFALAVTAGGKDKPGWDESCATILFHPSYGQIDYFSPVLLCLAREYRRPVYQYLALRDKTLGTLQKTRFITPDGEHLLFSLGGFTYAWCDESVPASIEKDLPLQFGFPEVNEACARSSYKPRDMVVGVRRGLVGVHAADMPVLVEIGKDTGDVAEVSGLSVSGDAGETVIECGASQDLGFDKQTVRLTRPNRLAIHRQGNRGMSFWCQSMPLRKGSTLEWSKGKVILKVIKGEITSVDSKGHEESMIVGMGKLRCVDPMPKTYPLIKLTPVDGELLIQITKK